jgi:hypothetical protein
MKYIVGTDLGIKMPMEQHIENLSSQAIIALEFCSTLAHLGVP